MRNKTAVLITGATSGIGMATTRRLASNGYTVYAGVYRASPQQLTSFEQVDFPHQNVRAVKLDVTDLNSINDAKDFILESIPAGHDFALVNNAGVAFGSPIEAESMAKIRLQMEVNYFGVVQMIRSFIPVLRQRRGRIVNISSISGKSSMPFNGSYCASKFALEAITDALRLELSPWKISTTNILPGDIKTGIWEKALQEIDRETSEWSDDLKHLYSTVPEFMKTQIRKVDGSDPDIVAAKVESILAARNPPTRAYVGNRVWLYYFLEKLPTFVRDRLIQRMMPRYGQNARRP